jgi:2-phosphoglycerate kinase
MQPSVQWIVTLVCGASGTGKSCLARPLAERYGVPLAEADDIVTGLQAITTPEQQPMLHFWQTHPQSRSWAPERIAARHFEVASALRPAYAAVIADHVEFAAPVVFEGDYLLPELVAETGTAVRAVLLDEQDEDQIAANYLRREPGAQQQRDRAKVSALVSTELARRARRCGVPVVPARPWADGLDRVDKALREI